jgi:RHS repeat-associated protein
LYSGEQFDSKIGQQYLRQRYYDPATGRFNRLDPFFGNLDAPQSLHKYTYAHNNPIIFSDPTGLNAGVMAFFAQFLSTFQLTENGSDLSWLNNIKLQAYLDHHKGVGKKIDILTKVRRQYLTDALYASKLVYNLQSGYGLTIVKKNGEDVVWNLKNDLTAALYMNQQGKYILAFSGTKSLQGWRTNIHQALGSDQFIFPFEADITQYKSVYKVMEDVKQITNSIYIITGHSLGGGLATLASIIYGDGSPLVIFNPAHLHQKTIDDALALRQLKKLPKEFFQLSEIWQVHGDPLAQIQGLPNKIPNWLYDIPKRSVIELKNSPLLDRVLKLTPGNLHSLDVFEKFFLDIK